MQVQVYEAIHEPGPIVYPHSCVVRVLDNIVREVDRKRT